MAPTPDDFTLDDEFQNYLDPLTNEERERLRASIKRDGCRDCGVVWREWRILIDGYNRYEICRELELPFETTELSFHSRDEVLEWILKNQLGRRNISDAKRVVLNSRLKPILAAKAKENLRLSPGAPKKVVHELDNLTTAVADPTDSAVAPLVAPDEKVDTLADIAKASGVSRATVHKVETVMKKADAPTKSKMLSGEVSISAAYKTVQPPPVVDNNRRRGVEIAHKAIGVLRSISMNDELRSRGYEIVADFIANNPPSGGNEKFPGWVELRVETLGRVQQYCSQHPAACSMVEKSLRETLKKIEGYRKSHVAGQKSRRLHPVAKDELDIVEAQENAIPDGEVAE